MGVSGRLRLVVTGLLAVFMLCGCSGANGSSPTPGMSSTATPTVSRTLTPTPSPSTDQERAAVAAVNAYIRVVDKLGIDSTSDINELTRVATGDALAQMQYILLNYRKDGWRVTGTTVPTFDKATAGATAADWTIAMCVGLGGVDVVDPAGRSVKNHDGPSRVRIEYIVNESMAAHQWYVAKETAVGPC